MGAVHLLAGENMSYQEKLEILKRHRENAQSKNYPDALEVLRNDEKIEGMRLGRLETLKEINELNESSGRFSLWLRHFIEKEIKSLEVKQ